MSATILLLGCGKMGSALLQGWRAAGAGTQDFSVHVIEPDGDKRAQIASNDVPAYEDVDALAKDFVPDAVVLAVEPGTIPKTLEVCRRWSDTQAVVLSVAAGVRLGDMAARLPASNTMSLIRVMPNIPALVGAGMSVCCAGEGTSKESRRLAEWLLEGIGEIAWIEEEVWMDSVTAVSGCGPAYVFHFIEALMSAGVSAGLPEDLSRRLAVATVAGAGRLAQQSEEDAGALRRRVATPGGATAAALKVLMQEGRLESLLRESVEAAKKRSEELGKQKS